MPDAQSTSSQTAETYIRPIVSYPHSAEVGKTYRLTIDLELDDATWPYEEEEYTLYCMVNAKPGFTSKSVGKNALVLHRFGGTYSPVQFLLHATESETQAKINIAFVNHRGVPVQSFTLPSVSITNSVENREVVGTWNSPVPDSSEPIPERHSSVIIIPSVEREPEKPLLLIDFDIPKRWSLSANKTIGSEDVAVYDGESLASLTPENIEQFRQAWEDDVVCITPSELFLPQLTFIDHVLEAIPGGLMSGEQNNLSFEGEIITPLIPLNPLLLDYMRSEDICDRLRFREAERGNTVEVSLDLSLSGIENDEPYTITRTYALRAENTLDGVPVLEIWPNIKSKGWKEYYAFYFDAGLGKDTFHVGFLNPKETRTFQDSQGGNYQSAKFDRFPNCIHCLNDAQILIGIILLKQPGTTVLDREWTVGVDLGNKLTNIYVKQDDNIAPLELKPLNLRVADSPFDTRFGTLFEYFVPENFIPDSNPLPLKTILTTRGAKTQDKREMKPILDGRIYCPNLAMSEENEWEEPNLQEGDAEYRRLFLSHLFLHISAIAVKEGIREINWMLSYPYHFTSIEITNYVKMWSGFAEKYSETTGIIHKCPSTLDGRHYKSNHAAFSRYFAEYERSSLISAACINIDSNMSHISIWENNALCHQTSFSLAKNDILIDLILKKPSIIEQFRMSPSFDRWEGMSSDAQREAVSTMLYWNSQDWLRDIRPTLTDEAEFQNFIQIVSIGVAGLYYYTGIMLRALQEANIYRNTKDTPVYIGNRGATILNWLDSTGEFSSHSEVNDLLSQILGFGSGSVDAGGSTLVSQNIGDEVACGLVISQSVFPPENLNERYFIPGEDCIINNQRANKYDRVKANLFCEQKHRQQHRHPRNRIRLLDSCMTTTQR